MKQVLLILIVLIFTLPAFSGEITRCESFQAPVDYDAINFMLKKKTNSSGFDSYHYLMDSVLIKKVGELELKAWISIFLQDADKAIIRYQEAIYKRRSETEAVQLEVTFRDEFETTWSSSGYNLVVDGVGQGQSASCYSDGYDVYFTYNNDIGPSKIKNKKLILHYGFSTYDPFKK